MKEAENRRSRRRTEAQVEQLDRVLLAIRNVNRLVMHERDPRRLIGHACSSLVATRACRAAWIALLDDARDSVVTAEAGFGQAFAEMAEHLNAGKLPGCGAAALASPDVVVVTDPRSTCRDCPLESVGSDHGSLTTRLENGGKVYGLMSISLPSELAGDEDGTSLLSAIATDIALALSNIESEGKLGRYAQIVAGSQEATALIDREYRFLEANPSYARFVERSAAEIVGCRVPEVLGAEVFEHTVKEHLDRAFAGEDLRFEGSLGIAGTEPRAVETGYSPCRDPDGSISAVAVSVRDVPQRKAAEEALRTSEDNFKRFFDGSVDGILVADPETKKLLLGNTTILRMTGYTQEEITELGIGDIHPEEDLPGAFEDSEKQARREANRILNMPVRRKDGSVFHADIHTTLIVLEGRTCLMGTFKDTTERKEMLANLAQTDRLASMGMLAAGVAHEINNPLAYVLYNLESLSEDLPRLIDSMKRCYSSLSEKLEPEDLANVLGDAFNPAMFADVLDRTKDALSGTGRIKGIAHGLGAFSRVEGDELSEVDLRYAIECAVNIAYNEIKYRARLVKDYGDVPTVLASDGRISQVFLNLIINAAHAVDEGDAANNEIRVRTWAQGNDVFAEVSDTGKGILPENMDRVFDAFFTTKSVGAGSGLGLSICQSIITSYGGDLDVWSEVDRGTRFTIRLPAAREREEVRSEELAEEKAAAVRGRILVVDDEAGIRSSITRVLRGHEVVTVSSGEEGQSLLREDVAFDAILCDMMMLGMSGMDLHEWLVAENSALARRVIFFTGGAFTPRAREYLRKVDNPCIEKPFDAAGLRRVVSRQIATTRGHR
jgi:PAS domain S-box-containing protein